MTEEQLNKEAEERYPELSELYKDDEYSRNYLVWQRREAFKAGFRYRDKEVEELKEWKEDQMRLWLPLIEWGQNESGFKPGVLISEEVLKICKHQKARDKEVEELKQEIAEMKAAEVTRRCIFTHSTVGCTYPQCNCEKPV